MWQGNLTNAELLSLITGDGGGILSDHGITFINDELNAYNAYKPLMRDLAHYVEPQSTTDR